MWWPKEITELKRRLTEAEAESQRAQQKLSRLSAFLDRVRSFGVSASGHIPKREFSEALVDCLHELLNAEQVLLLEADRTTLDMAPIAGRGFSPETLARIRVHEGEGTLGRAMQQMKMAVHLRE